MKQITAAVILAQSLSPSFNIHIVVYLLLTVCVCCEKRPPKQPLKLDDGFDVSTTARCVRVSFIKRLSCVSLRRAGFSMNSVKAPELTCLDRSGEEKSSYAWKRSCCQRSLVHCILSRMRGWSRAVKQCCVSLGATQRLLPISRQS